MLRVWKNKTLEELKWKLIGFFGKLFIDALFLTTRIEFAGIENVQHVIDGRKAIVAFWHSRILLLSYLYQGENAIVLVSRSEDGEIIARIIERQGHEPVRGSTSKGGLRALAKLIRTMKNQIRPAVIIPDGPQGPRFKVQPGIITLAKKTGYPILPVTYSARKMKIFGSWDRFVLPRPFTRCRVVYGNPVFVPEQSGRSEEERCRVQLEETLCHITADADRYFGHTII